MNYPKEPLKVLLKRICGLEKEIYFLEKEIASGGDYSLPNLQEVTDVGNETTKSIKLTGLSPFINRAEHKRNDSVFYLEGNRFESTKYGFRRIEHTNDHKVLTIDFHNNSGDRPQGTFFFPDLGASTIERYLPVSVNGEVADVNGNITISTGGIPPTGLEALDEGNGVGWRLIGRNPDNYGNLGNNAIDFSVSNSTSTTRGATGPRSVNFGLNNTTSGANSITQGINNENTGARSLVIGDDNKNPYNDSIVVGSKFRGFSTNGYSTGSIFLADYTTSNLTVHNNIYASLIGGSDSIIGTPNATLNQSVIYQSVINGWNNNIYAGESSLAVGQALLGGAARCAIVGVANEDLTSTVATQKTADRQAYNPRFIVGVGDWNSDSNTGTRANGFVVMSDGTASFPSLTNTMIDSSSGKSAVTKDWVIANSGGGGSTGNLQAVTDVGNETTNNIIIDGGNVGKSFLTPAIIAIFDNSNIGLSLERGKIKSVANMRPGGFQLTSGGLLLANKGMSGDPEVYMASYLLDRIVISPQVGTSTIPRGTFVFPNLPSDTTERRLPVSVNGEVADANGNITIPTGGGGGIPDAPADGQNYGRQDNAWEVITSLTDAPSDGKQYARKDANWSEVVIPTGLESIDEGNGIGWRLIGRNPAGLQNIGLGAIDFTEGGGTYNEYGASGTRSFSVGLISRAEGDNSIAMGRQASAKGQGSVALSESTANGNRSFSANLGEADGELSTALGWGKAIGEMSFAHGWLNKAHSYLEVSFGKNPIEYTPISATSWQPLDRIFNIGVGLGPGVPKNAFTVLKNGMVSINEQTIAHINTIGAKAVITKEYADATYSGGSSLQLGETSTTAYRGDRGKIAYDHSQVPHAPADAQKNVQTDWNATSGDDFIKNKPTEFPPSAHNHPISQVTGLQTALNGKMDNANVGPVRIFNQDPLTTITATGTSWNSFLGTQKIELTAAQVAAGKSYSFRVFGKIETTNATDVMRKFRAVITAGGSTEYKEAIFITSVTAEAQADISGIFDFGGTPTNTLIGFYGSGMLLKADGISPIGFVTSAGSPINSTNGVTIDFQFQGAFPEDVFTSRKIQILDINNQVILTV